MDKENKETEGINNLSLLTSNLYSLGSNVLIEMGEGMLRRSSRICAIHTRVACFIPESG